MNRREFLASVAALGGVVFGLPGPDPEIPVVLLWKWRLAANDWEVACEEWYGVRIAYRYAWAWCDGDRNFPGLAHQLPGRFIVTYTNGTLTTEAVARRRGRLADAGRALSSQARMTRTAQKWWWSADEVGLAARRTPISR